MKIGIIGAGYVGSSTAFALSMCDVANEIVLVNRTMSRAKAEAIDIRDALPNLCDTVVQYGELRDIQGSDIVLLTCGKNRGGKNIDRMTLLYDNSQMLLEILPVIKSYASNAIIVVATSPVDVLSSLVMRVSGIDASRVIGSGTLLDTARFRNNIAEYFGVPVHDVYADVFGEHGNSQVSIWSTVTINGHLISDSNNSNRYSLSDDDKMAINHATKYGADIVLAGKQATCFGIAGALTSICKAIKYDAMLPMNISCLHENCFGVHDVFLSTPTIIGREGIARMLPYSLSQQESEQLELSANIISQATEKIISLIS